MEILNVQNLSFYYPDAAKPAVDNVSFSVNEGEFLLVCGHSGCGKTTLLRLIKKSIMPNGRAEGSVLYCGKNIDENTYAESEIGYVFQNPENQIVTESVYHELAFGLENIGVENGAMRRRIAETATYFGLEGIFEKNTSELSGGQKQLLNLAAVTVMQPRVLLLDEPTAQLDPIAASDFLATVKKLNTELGLTVIVVEQRLEQLFDIADRVLVMQNGGICALSTPRDIPTLLFESDVNHPMLAALPVASRVFSALDFNDECPLSVNEGRQFLQRHFEKRDIQIEAENSKTEVAAELKNVYFKFERELPDVLRGASLKMYFGEVLCILGGNGAGKTTLLKIAAGLLKPYRGSVQVLGKHVKAYNGNSLYKNAVAYLPQTAQNVFTENSVYEDLRAVSAAYGENAAESEKSISLLAKRLKINQLLNKHPYDLSGGEVQRCAIAKVLLTRPKILLLDEPTKGLDSAAKNELAAILKTIKQAGMAVVTVTHDLEFAAAVADRCAMLFAGDIISQSIPRDFFASNSFYTTAANRMARTLNEKLITADDVISFCKGEL